MTSVLNYAVADEKIAEETHLKPLVQNLTTALTKEDEDLKISQKSLLTDEITKADNLRDSLYRAYKKAVKTYLDLPIAAQAQAAKVLNQHIKDYGMARLCSSTRKSVCSTTSSMTLPPNTHGTSHNPRIAKFRNRIGNGQQQSTNIDCPTYHRTYRYRERNIEGFTHRHRHRLS